jgi:hypothetical protein
MSGRFRRALVLISEPGLATGEVEDDFHHFAVAVRHDGAHVTAAEGRAMRHPWSECPNAGAALGALMGLALDAHPTAVYRHLDPLSQCTHMLETAALAVAQAGRGLGRRRYDIEVATPSEGRVKAKLLRDGEPLADWTLQDGVVLAPAALAGLTAAGLSSSALQKLPPEEAEPRLILRRALWLAAGRGLDIDSFPTAAAMGRGRACFVFSPGVAGRAERRRGSVRDFSRGPGPLSSGTRC